MDLPFPYQSQKPLCEFSTFGIGGPARYFAETHTIESTQEMLQFSHQNSIPFLMIGKGSNCLFDDRGFNGLVILNKIDYLKEEGHGLFRVGAGYSFARLGGGTARQGWSGLEFASGIPATVGGAIYMNAGANGQETFDTLVEVKYVTEEGKVESFGKKNLYASYRTSVFQEIKGAIVEGAFILKASQQSKKSQKEILNYRLNTQPYGEKSIGCIFRNSPLMPAGKLIEECGLKGISVGDAKVSLIHANFIVNSNKATAQNVRDLITLIKEKVYQQKEVILKEEIKYIPYE